MSTTGLVVAAGISAATAAAGTAATYEQAKRQNRNLRDAAASEREAAKIAAERRRAEASRESQAFLGSVRASSASRGAAGSASSLAIMQSAVAQTERATGNINTQLYNDVTSINSKASAQSTNPSALAFQSGLAGLSNTTSSAYSGYNIGRALEDS